MKIEKGLEYGPFSILSKHTTRKKPSIQGYVYLLKYPLGTKCYVNERNYA